MPLTDTAIRNAKPGPKPIRLFDGGGLYLELSPAGGKWWRLKYRVGGKEKRLSLGTYPETSLKAARERRDDARKLLQAGTDPSAARRADREAQRTQALNTLESVAREWLKHRSPAWTSGTLATITASLENDVFPRLGTKAVAAIQPADIRETVKAIEARGAGEMASRVFQRLRSIYRYAVAHDLVTVDPTYPLKPSEIFKPRKVKHRASFAERDVPEYLHRLAGYQGDVITKAALELLTLTAVRPGELRGTRWNEIDEVRATWRIPAERMKMKTEHIVPLSDASLAVLKSLRPVSGDGELAFPSPFYPEKSISENTLNSALSRMGFKGIATAHGFRTLFSTCANEAGWKSDVIERQLSHEDRDEVRGAYNRAQWLDERRKLMQWWADYLGKLRQGAEVLPLRAA